MPPVVIENPVLNSPSREPARHFGFDDDGITDQIADGRQCISYFVPIARPRAKSGQLRFDTEWTADRVEENERVDRIRARVAIWRQGGWAGATNTTVRVALRQEMTTAESRTLAALRDALLPRLLSGDLRGVVAEGQRG